MGSRVVDIEVFECNKSSFLTVLFKNHDDRPEAAAGNNIRILDGYFRTVFELKDMQYHYTSVFKWNSIDGSNIICSAFTVFLSKIIHSMKIDIAQVRLANILLS